MDVLIILIVVYLLIGFFMGMYFIYNCLFIREGIVTIELEGIEDDEDLKEIQDFIDTLSLLFSGKVTYLIVSFIILLVTSLIWINTLEFK